MLKKTALYILMSGLILHANEHLHDLTQGLNPDISLIMDVSYVNRNLSDEEINHLEIPGIAHGINKIGLKVLQDRKQNGYYTQLVYAFNENYNCRLKYDSIGLTNLTRPTTKIIKGAK